MAQLLWVGAMLVAATERDFDIRLNLEWAFLPRHADVVLVLNCSKEQLNCLDDAA